MLPNQTRTVLLQPSVQLGSEANIVVPGSVLRGRRGSPRAHEEIKEEGICCTYVDQISEHCAPDRESLLKGTSVA